MNEIILAKEEIYGLWIRVLRDEGWMGNKGVQKMASNIFPSCRLFHLCRKFCESLTRALCADSSTTKEGGRRLNVPEFHKEEADLRANR
jgi:hypothetical protein